MNALKYFSIRMGLILAAALWFSSCQGDEPEGPHGKLVPVTLDLSGNGAFGRAFEGPHNVDRIVVIPFVSAAESPSNNDQFTPLFDQARVMEVYGFPHRIAKLWFSEEYTYKLLVVGYNHEDYDWSQRDVEGNTNRFKLNFRADVDPLNPDSPRSLATFCVEAVEPANVPDIFTCICVAGGSNEMIKLPTSEPMTIRGTLTRLVGGLSLTLTNIPSDVQSVQLVTAANLVAASYAVSREPVLLQPPSSGTKVFGTKAPQNGAVTFENLVLPTNLVNQVKFALNIVRGGVPLTPFPVVVKQRDPYSSADGSLYFYPNIGNVLTGDYSKIVGLGAFQLVTKGINLDNDNWDGHTAL